MTPENTQKVLARYCELLGGMTAQELEQFATHRRARSLSGVDAYKYGALVGDNESEKTYLSAWQKLNGLESFLRSPMIQPQMSRHEAFEREVNSVIAVLKSKVDQNLKAATQEQRDFLASEGKRRGKPSFFKALRSKF